MKIVEINDKDERHEKTTYFVLHVQDSQIVDVEQAIRKTWGVDNYDVVILKQNIIKELYPTTVEFIYDCTDPDQKNKVVELGF